jgi:hypothetical protein
MSFKILYLICTSETTYWLNMLRIKILNAYSTFRIGTMAMMAASVFFFFEVNNTPKKWRTSVLVSGLITMIA